MTGRPCTSPNLSAKAATAPPAANAAAHAFLGNRAHRTQVSVRGATAPDAPDAPVLSDSTAPTCHTRASLSSPAVHMDAPVLSNRSARIASVCHREASGASAPPSRAAAAAASKAHVDSSVASAPLSVSNTRTSVPNATAMSVRSGFTAIKGLGACRMCSPPQFSPGPPFPPPAPSVPGSAPLCLRLFRRGIARSRTTPHAPFLR